MKEIRPDYYKSNGIETIDVIEAFDLNFCLGNVIKYVLRAGKKDGEDKKKDLTRARDRVTELNRIDNAKFDSDDGYHVFRIKELEIDKDMEYGVEV